MTETSHREIEAVCERLIRQFAFLNDAHDHDALAEMFVADGSFARPSDPDNPVIGREKIRAFFRDRPKRRTRHLMNNIVVEVQSGTVAHARSYVLLYAGERGEDVLVGDFHDVLRLDETGRWRFQSRRGSLAFT